MSAGVVQPPKAAVSHDDDPYPAAALSQQDTSYEVKWKAEFVRGDGLSPSQNTSALNDIAVARTNVTITVRQANSDWTANDNARHTNPASFPSLLLDWIRQGGTHFQRFFSRLCDSWRFLRYLEALPDLQGAARLRGVLSAISSQPLRTLPNKPERIYTNANFQWFLCNRVQAQQPSAKSISLQSCECSIATDPPTLKDGRHFRRCKKNNTVLNPHNTMRDLLIIMAKAAGLTIRREPHGLLRDNKEGNQRVCVSMAGPLAVSLILATPLTSPVRCLTVAGRRLRWRRNAIEQAKLDLQG